MLETTRMHRFSLFLEIYFQHLQRLSTRHSHMYELIKITKFLQDSISLIELQPERILSNVVQKPV